MCVLSAALPAVGLLDRLPACRYQAEKQEQRILFRGTFATQRPGGAANNALDVYVKNTSNTNVICWGGRLWSLFEAGQPYRLNPHTLETEVRCIACKEGGRGVQWVCMHGPCVCVCGPGLGAEVKACMWARHLRQQQQQQQQQQLLLVENAPPPIRAARTLSNRPSCPPACAPPARCRAWSCWMASFAAGCPLTWAPQGLMRASHQ